MLYLLIRVFLLQFDLFDETLFAEFLNISVVEVDFSETPGKVHIILKLYLVWVFDHDVSESLPYALVVDLLCGQRKTPLNHVIKPQLIGLVLQVLGHFMLKTHKLLRFFPTLLLEGGVTRDCREQLRQFLD